MRFPPLPPTRPARRACVAAIVVTLASATFPSVAFGVRGYLPVASSDGPPASRPAIRAPAADQAPVPSAWLAWTPGGLPPGFREGIERLPSIDRAAVFAGDTIWLTRSSDASGRTVDAPQAPFALPIDAFAVDPDAVAPFLPRGARHPALTALRGGRAVIGTWSAQVRDLGVGGTLAFGSERVVVGAVVPDAAIGWAEVLVATPTGRRLGVVHDRHAWFRTRRAATLRSVTRSLRRIVPAGEPLRVEPPGATRYLRTANGVDPPIVLKEALGEFAAAVDPSAPWSFRVAPAWTDAHLVSRHVPLLGRLTCHETFMRDLVAAMEEVRRQGLSASIRSTAGCFNPRTVARSPTNPPSFHAYGAAVDINAPENPFGAEPTMDPRVVAIFERLGFRWGGDFLIPDGMHFEFDGTALTGG